MSVNLIKNLVDILDYYAEIKGTHPAAKMFRFLAEKELETPTEYVKAKGLANPLILFHSHLLVDGRLRLLACYKVQQDICCEILPDRGRPWKVPSP